MKTYLPIINFPKQQLIFDNPARYVIVPKGRRFGATNGAANNFIRLALRHEFQKGLWVDTVNANIERYVERYFIPKLMKLSARDDKWQWRKQQKILQILDSYIDFRSVDTPENIEGFGYDYAFLNEAGIILRNEYLWQNAIRPMLWDYKCHTIAAGTPKGKGVFHELYQRGLDPQQPEFASLTFSSFDNPYLPRDTIMEDIKSMPQRVVDQEIYAQFLDDTGVVFRGVKAIATILNEWVEPKFGHIYVCGVDVAKLVDWTVITVYDRADNRQVCQLRFNGLEWPAIRGRIRDVSMRYNNALVYLDSTGVGEPTYDDLSREHVPVEAIHFTNELKKQIIEKLSNWIELRRFRMFNDPYTINEFNSFTYDISEKTGRVFYGAPVGFHDDVVIAHGLAIWALQPVALAESIEDMSIIQKDILRKTGRLDEGDDFEEVQDWGIGGQGES